ncbi:hypothetical protein AB1399_02720 [Hydrogenibacillus schlegelii]|uniref:hypothetical protein n=2 Tax=Hydrogenibacillus schlegelii TaxID=1484 RepID=UPI001B8057C2|nr:hypothetical protein [Hydrogenibacillus schlegelii]
MWFSWRRKLIGKIFKVGIHTMARLGARWRAVSLAVLAVALASLLISGGVHARADSLVASPSGDPWGQKEVLNYLFWTADPKLEQDVIKLQNELGLDNQTIMKLKELGLRERQSIAELRTKEAFDVVAFNSGVDAAFIEIDRETREVLGPKYETFRKWIRDWWNQEKEYRGKWIAEKLQKETEVAPLADFEKGVVFATQYYGDSSWQVALPDKYVKFANRGWLSSIPSSIRPKYSNPPYTVNIYYQATNKSVLGVPVQEVGPWNEDDNYWDAANGSNPRRLFKDLPLGKPEAQAAFYEGYNGGKDQFGRKVTNPAGIDLTPYVASQLGLGYLQNAWVEVRYSDLP